MPARSGVLENLGGFPVRILLGQVSVFILALFLADIDFWLGLFLLLLFFSISLLFARSLHFSLRRLLDRSRSLEGLIGGEGETALSAASLGAEAWHLEPTRQFAELELSLDHLRNALQKRSAEIARDRVQLDTVLGSMSDLLIAADRNGGTLFYNRRFAEQLLVPTDERPRLTDIFRSPDILEAFRKCMAEGTLQQVSVQLALPPYSIARYFSLAISPLKTAENVVYGTVGIFHDITELKLAEKIRADFVANASHELKSPLTSIKGYVDTLKLDIKSGGSGEQFEGFVTTISKNVDRLMDLVKDILDLATLDAGDLGSPSQRAIVDAAERRTTIQPRQITERVLSLIEPNRKARDHVITAEYSEGGFLGDPKRLEQVLVNLLDNACKYTPSGGKITVKWEDKATCVRLAVEDSGPGIPPEHQSRVFERFYRVDPGRSRDAGGTGLGLAIVKHIVQNHGGRVWVENRPEGGARFICEFPA